MPTRRFAFCTAADGARLAFGIHGSGPAIVKAANWMTHLEHDWQSPVWRHWLEGLGAHTTRSSTTTSASPRRPRASGRRAAPST